MRAYDGDSNLDYMSERPFFGDRGIPDMGNTCQSVSGKKEHSGVQLKKVIKSALQPSLAKGTGASGWRQGGRARSMFTILDFIQYFGGVVVEGRWMIRSAFFKDCLAAVQRLEWRGGRVVPGREEQPGNLAVQRLRGSPGIQSVYSGTMVLAGLERS